jgi:predicted nucleic acid-binding protein
MAVRCFADTFYFLALFSSEDLAHEEAVRLTAELSPHLVTTDAVLLEVVDALRHPRNRKRAANWVLRLWARPDTTVHPVGRDLLERGLALFEARQDKEWSLTDCVSFVVMQEEGIGQALTGDAHFQQAGFRVLFEPR